MKKLLLIGATLLVLAVSGCAPQVDVEAEEAAIRSALDVGMLGAAKEKNVEGVLATTPMTPPCYRPMPQLQAGRLNSTFSRRWSRHRVQRWQAIRPANTIHGEWKWAP